jgi:hypothetical protein
MKISKSIYCANAKDNDSQNNTQKTNNGATRTPLKIENALVGVAGTAPDKIVLDLSIRK